MLKTICASSLPSSVTSSPGSSFFKVSHEMCMEEDALSYSSYTPYIRCSSHLSRGEEKEEEEEEDFLVERGEEEEELWEEFEEIFLFEEEEKQEEKQKERGAKRGS